MAEEAQIRPALAEVLARLAVTPSDKDAWGVLYVELWPFVMSQNYRRFGGAAATASGGWT